MRKFFVLWLSSILLYFSSAVYAEDMEVTVDVDAAILSMHQKINYLTNELNNSQNQIESLQENLKIVKQKITEIFKMLEVEATNKVIEDVIVARKENEDKALALYSDARDQLKFGAHEEAVALFNDYIARYVDYKNAVDSQYWLGRALYAKQSYREAKDVFVQFQKDNPLHPRYAYSMYDLAQILVKLSEIEAAKAMLVEMLDKFPTHSLRIDATNKLKEIQALKPTS